MSQFLDNVVIVAGAGLAVGGTERTVVLAGSTYDVPVVVHVEDSEVFGLGVHAHHATATVGALVELSRSRGSEGSESAVQDDDTLGAIYGLGHDGTDYHVAGIIAIHADGNASNNSVPGKIVFSTSTGSSTVRRLTIYSDGEVALGTDGWLDFDEHTSAPGTPASGRVALYAKADGKLYSKDDAGTETQVSLVSASDLTSGTLATARLPGGDWITASTDSTTLTSSHTITSSAGTYEDTGLTLTLPAAGTYLMTASVRGELQCSAGSAFWLSVRLYNQTDGAAVTDSERIVVGGTSTGFYYLNGSSSTWEVTVAASKEIRLQVKRDGSGGPTYTVSFVGGDAQGKSNLTYTQVS